MKKGDLLDNEHHVLRHVKNRLVIRADNGDVLGLFPGALELREGEDSLSVNWCEYYGAPNNHGVITSCINSFKQDFDVKPKSVFVLGNIGDIHSSHANLTGKKNLRIKYWADPKIPKQNPSHSAISNLDQNSDTLTKLLREAFYRIYDTTCNPIP